MVGLYDNSSHTDELNKVVEESTESKKFSSQVLISKDLGKTESTLIKNEPPYTILSYREICATVFLLSCCGFWSAVSNSIYFPALTVIEISFRVSPELNNVSIVAYLILQGVSPTLMSFFADFYGRRPTLCASLISYAAVCLGISRSNAFWLLVVLRCFQASSIASLISITSASVGDIVSTEKRGNFMGINSGIQLLGQGFGPLIGALLVHGFGWRGIFVFLAIGSCSVFAILVFFLLETNRSIVGNLSIRPTNIVNKAPLLSLSRFRRRMVNDRRTLRQKKSMRAQFVAPFKIFFVPVVLASLFAVGIQFCTWNMMLTTLSTSLQKKYNKTIIEVGLCYLCPGFGTLSGSILGGRVLDLIYKRARLKYDAENIENKHDQKSQFDIVSTRLKIYYVGTFTSVCFNLVFGWCVEYRVNLAPILISTYICSFFSTSNIAAVTVLLVDMFPSLSSALASCMNLMRCLLSAVGVAALQSMTDKMGEGGCYTLMSGFILLGYVLLKLTLYLKGIEKIEDLKLLRAFSKIRRK